MEIHDSEAGAGGQSLAARVRREGAVVRLQADKVEGHAERPRDSLAAQSVRFTVTQQQISECAKVQIRKIHNISKATETIGQTTTPQIEQRAP